MNLNKRPYLSSYNDRHGKLRWRFRYKGKVVSLHGQPGEKAFEEAYRALLNGQEPIKPIMKTAHIVAMPRAAMPRSLGAAWNLVKDTAEWKKFAPPTKKKNEDLADQFLNSCIIDGVDVLWKDAPVKDLKRRHLKEILSRYSDTPHKAKHMLTTIRKMIIVALDQEWIEVDPSYKLNWRPDYVGWKAWTDETMRAFEEKWAIGTTPRLVYALALGLGNRRSDIVTLRWDQRCEQPVTIAGERRVVDGFQFQHAKTGKRLFLPIMPMLSEVLAATERRGETILITSYGKPFSAKSLTGRMRDWTNAAGISQGFTLHGLRKTLGKMLAEGGASTRQIMETLGHDDIQHAELYSREAEQARLAIDGMERVVRLQKRG